MPARIPDPSKSCKKHAGIGSRNSCGQEALAERMREAPVTLKKETAGGTGGETLRALRQGCNDRQENNGRKNRHTIRNEHRPKRIWPVTGREEMAWRNLPRRQPRLARPPPNRPRRVRPCGRSPRRHQYSSAGLTGRAGRRTAVRLGGEASSSAVRQTASSWGASG